MLLFRAMKLVMDSFHNDPKIETKQWHTKLKLLEGVDGYKPNAPSDPTLLLTMYLLQLWRPNLKMLETVLQEMKNIDPKTRSYIRSLAGSFGIPSSTLCRMKKKKKLRVHTMSLKPKLTDDHRLNRLYHCISNIDKNTITGTAEMKYKTMHNEVHVDEKCSTLSNNAF
jgi:hypothetical protein